jgi:hypothetical protein
VVVPVPLKDHSKRAFEDSVRTILTTFGVFTGFAIKSAIDGIHFPPSKSWGDALEALWDPQLFVCLATIALLLRFIIGSAVHLNLCYVVEPRSTKRIMLFKDLAFLIAFGLAAIFMIKAGDKLAAYSTRAFIFVLVGMIWSGVDAVTRKGETEGEQSLFSGYWVVIDFAQLIWILFAYCLIYYVFASDLTSAILLAVGFWIALCADMMVVLSAKKPYPPGEPALPVEQAAAAEQPVTAPA